MLRAPAPANNSSHSANILREVQVRLQAMWALVSPSLLSSPTCGPAYIIVARCVPEGCHRCSRGRLELLASRTVLGPKQRVRAHVKVLCCAERGTAGLGRAENAGARGHHMCSFQPPPGSSAAPPHPLLRCHHTWAHLFAPLSVLIRCTGHRRPPMSLSRGNRGTRYVLAPAALTPLPPLSRRRPAASCAQWWRSRAL